MTPVRIAVLALFFVVGACSVSDTDSPGYGLPSPIITPTEAQEAREAPTGMASGEKVTIFANRLGGAGPNDSGFTGCVRQAMLKTNPSLKFVPVEEFRDALYPWFEPATAPDNPDALAEVLKRRVVQQRIATLGVRYVVSVGGGTWEGEDKGFILAGHGCIGFAWKDRESALDATVWDLKDAAMAGTLEASASGTAAILCYGVPIPLISPTETEACAELGQRVADFLTGRPPAKE